MPSRKYPLVENSYYHAFNRVIENKPVFDDTHNCDQALQAIDYYRNADTPIKLSVLNGLSLGRYLEVLEYLESQKNLLVEIIAYCIMPNHFHFLLKQIKKNGIAKFLANFQNSFTRYYNTKNKRRGPIFLTQFKAKPVKSENQFLHISRYIHLNPYSAKIVKTQNELLEYPWSSLKEYATNDKKGICNKDAILSNLRTPQRYIEFVLDNADYQKSLQEIKTEIKGLL